jgi:tRNA wybutosine-synthesizing protein 3
MPEVFDDRKRIVLSKLGKPDRSRKGSVDEEAVPFLDLLNGLPDYYSTSSCAGRITVFKEPASGKKPDAEWLYASHALAKPEEVIAAVEKLPEETVWLRMESPIFHIACRDQDAADRLLKVCQSSGWKRSGIISTGGRKVRQQRVMLEIIGNERLDTPIAVEGRLLFELKFLRFLTAKANEKLAESRERLEELRKAVKKALTQ